MKRRTAFLVFLAVLVLVGAQTAYGYWVETLSTAWTLPVTYPVTLEIQAPPEEALAELPAEADAEAAEEPQTGEEPMAEEEPVIEEAAQTEGQAEDTTP